MGHSTFLSFFTAAWRFDRCDFNLIWQSTTSQFPFVVYPPEDPTIREANDRFRQQQLEALERQSREAEQKAKQQQ